MDRPLFSIITPTFRRPALLARNIRSVLAQSFKDFEHLVVDDANDPETEQLVKRFRDKRLWYFRHKTPGGAGGGYNTGIRNARGEFILFLDDDDEYLPSFLEKMYDYFSGSGMESGFAWTGIARVKESGKRQRVISSKIWPSRFSSREKGLVAATSIGNGFGVCVRRECTDAVGFYDESLKFGQDTEYLFRLARNFEFGTIPEVLVRIHVHEETQLTDIRNNRMRMEMRERILEKHADLLNKYPRLYSVHHKALAALAYRLGLSRKGRRIMGPVIRKTPWHLLNYSDLFFFELTGRDTFSVFRDSRIRSWFQK